MTGLPALGQVDGGRRASRRSCSPRAARRTCSTATTSATGSTATSASPPEDRAENVRRTAEVAALIADAGVVALASLVSPYTADREAARAVHERRGLAFLEVHVATPLEECERRDPKGLYASARAGELDGLTGVSEPYEAPESPDLRVVSGEPLDAAVDRVLALL